MSAVPGNDMPRTPAFNAVSAGLLLLGLLLTGLILATPQTPQDMMVPWVRPVLLLQYLVGSACVVLVWFRQGWAFYIYVGVLLAGVLLALIIGLPWPLLLVTPVLLVLYLWALHSGGPYSMWRQMFGSTVQPRRSMVHATPAAMPPSLPPGAQKAAQVAPAVAKPAPAVEPTDPLQALQRLGELRDRGVITAEEFAAKKSELLKRL